MENAAPAKAPTNPALIVFSAIAIFLAAIGSFAAYFLWPRGQRVGALDLREGSASCDVDLKPGDKLSFRLDVVVGTDPKYPDSSRGRSNAMEDELEASTLSVTLAQGDAVDASTRCRAFDGKVTTGSSNEREVKSSGMPLTCKLKANKPGKHTVRVSAAWVPKDMRKAKLEVRRERAED